LPDDWREQVAAAIYPARAWGAPAPEGGGDRVVHSGAFSCFQPSTSIPEPSALVCPAERATRDQVRLAR